ncbi:Dihydrofolate reductase [Nocardioides terrae]|uniref:Dihydrofolate reductase n=1 Tax=Nocardioides terrae TaxID=574651 RepID=A0A1I1FX72_9ACTN|nr:dihydrofolate reductase family protein [Nocardioides terrae]SFC03861.1 Dihydrofolate reductase [Nocardioides terrae]
MTRFVYATATTLDGFLADPDNSLDWLFAVEGGEESMSELETFVQGVSVLVMGSTTYEWILDHEKLLDHPEKWDQFYPGKKTYVFSSRDLPVIPGADISILRGPVADHLQAVVEAAAGKDVWLMGGGDLAGQFDDAGALDELMLSVAAVTLGAGAPLLPRRMESDRLRLVEVGRTGQFVSLRYQVRR